MIDDEEQDAFRAHVVEAVSSTWSYSEIREFSSKQNRDRDRLEEIMEMFAELSGEGLSEEAFWAANQFRNAQLRQRRAETKLLDRGEYMRRCVRERARYARIKAERPEVYAEILRRARARTREWQRINRPSKGLSTVKLTAESARQLREQHAAGVPQKDLAVIHGLTLSHIGEVLRGVCWGDAGGPLGARFAPARGERAANVRLTDAVALEIRESDEPVNVLAEKHGVSSQTVRDIQTGRCWKHLGGRRTPAKKHLDDAQRATIRKLYGQGMKQRDIAARFGVSQSGVGNIVREVQQ
jgi:hypothetical protein